MRKVILYIGISLDGYIATRDDNLDWLLATQGSGDNGFGEFYNTVDTIVMGRRTYDWIMEQEHGCFPYAGKQCFVHTRKPPLDTDFVRFTAQEPSALVAELRKQPGKKIWIVGGSQIIHLMREADLIDEYVLSIAPVILGSGIPLLRGGTENRLELTGVRTFGQFAELRYRVRKEE